MLILQEIFCDSFRIIMQVMFPDFITFKILKAFPKLSPPKQSLVNDEQMEKKTMQEKRKKRGVEKVKSRSQDSVMCHF